MSISCPADRVHLSGRVRVPAGRLRLLRQIRDELVPGVEQFLLVDDVVAVAGGAAGSVIGLYKTKLIHRRGPWWHLEAVEFATLEWVDWFNHRRLLIPIDNVPPVEFEQQYYLAQETLGTAAGLK